MGVHFLVFEFFSKKNDLKIDLFLTFEISSENEFQIVCNNKIMKFDTF